MIDILAPAIRIFVLWAFTRFATMGYLTPENATELTKVVMDLLVFGLPIIYAAWASNKAAKARK